MPTKESYYPHIHKVVQMDEIVVLSEWKGHDRSVDMAYSHGWENLFKNKTLYGQLETQYFFID